MEIHRQAAARTDGARKSMRMSACSDVHMRSFLRARVGAARCWRVGFAVYTIRLVPRLKPPPILPTAHELATAAARSTPAHDRPRAPCRCRRCEIVGSASRRVVSCGRRARNSRTDVTRAVSPSEVTSATRRCAADRRSTCQRCRRIRRARRLRARWGRRRSPCPIQCCCPTPADRLRRSRIARRWPRPRHLG